MEKCEEEQKHCSIVQKAYYAANCRRMMMIVYDDDMIGDMSQDKQFSLSSKTKQNKKVSQSVGQGRKEGRKADKGVESIAGHSYTHLVCVRR